MVRWVHLRRGSMKRESGVNKDIAANLLALGRPHHIRFRAAMTDEESIMLYSYECLRHGVELLIFVDNY